MKELERQLQMPEQEEHPVPQTGFKLPGIVWVAFVISLTIAIFSITTLWTLFIPFFLLPLPYQIIKRSFRYTQVQASLVMLPFAIFLTSLFTIDESIGFIADYSAFISIPFVVALIYVLRSPGMQRWGNQKQQFQSVHATGK
ncbi:MAG: hypothetical protein HC797_09950 [Anaerolineales bacterium]|nr:hypothetical protein [Anaerolineales bacterium]